MFRGCFEHTVDEKGRLSIPAKLRDALEATFSPPLILTHHKDCLAAYPWDEWRRLEAKMSELPTYDARVQAFKRSIYSPAQECPLDKAGRILIPPTLRTFAGIERDVVIGGMGKYIEIWAKDRHAAMMQATLENFDAIAEAMGAMGL